MKAGALPVAARAVREADARAAGAGGGGGSEGARGAQGAGVALNLHRNWNCWSSKMDMSALLILERQTHT